MTVVDRREETAGLVDDVAVAQPPSRRNAGLDGLRGVAVAVVVVFHLGRLQGGFLGVDLFFVLSGYLITSLLLGEVGATGRVGLGGFWARRARRLLPALLLVMTVTGGLLLLLTPSAERARFRGDGLATLGYVANWQRVFSERSYWDMFAQASPFDHMWSLAIEEQFYAAWPLLVVAVVWLVRHRDSSASRWVGATAALGATASATWMALSYNPLDTNWSYFSTPTRLAPVLAGSALAAFTPHLPTRGRGSRPPDAPAEPDCRPAPTASTRADSRPPEAAETDWHSASTTLTAADPRRPEVGRSGWLTALAALPAGRGWKTAGTAQPSVRGPVPTWVTSTVGIAGLAVIGWLVVEINGTAAQYYRGGLVAFTVASLVAVHSVVRQPDGPTARALSFTPLRLLGLVSYGVYLWHWPVIVFLTPSRAHIDGVALDVLRVAVVLAAATVSYLVVELPVRHGAVTGRRLAIIGPSVLAVSLAATVIGTSGKALPQFSDIPDGPLAGTDTLFLHVPPTVPPGAPRVLLVGDSGPQFLGPELVKAADEQGAAVAFSSEIECTATVPEGLTLQPNGTIERRESCQDHRLTLWQRLIEEYDPDVVVYYLANAGGLNKVRLDGEWTWDCDPTYDTYLANALRSDVDLLSSAGARVVFTKTPYVAVIDDTSRARTDCRNALLSDVATSRPGTEVVDLQSFVIDNGGFREGLFVDSFHFSPKGASLVATWLLPQILK